VLFGGCSSSSIMPRLDLGVDSMCSDSLFSDHLQFVLGEPQECLHLASQAAEVVSIPFSRDLKERLW
jgi:hypothetical protein